MSTKLIEQLLDDPDPAFACCVNDRRGVQARPPADETLIVPLTHLANPPATASLLKRIPDVPGAEEAKRFYSKYDGALLYTTRDWNDEGIEIFPIEQWKDRTAEMVGSWVEEADLYRDEDMPYGHNDFIAFAHSAGASNYIHWVTRGPRAGAVYWWAWTMSPRKDTPPSTPDFASFLKLIYDRPVQFFNEILFCYTRFSDGRTGKECLPNRYLPDQNHPSIGRH